MSPPLITIRALRAAVALRFDDSLSAEQQREMAAPWRGMQVRDAPTAHIDVRLLEQGESHPIAPSLLDSDATTVAAPSMDALAEQLSTQLTLAGLASMRGQALLLHAAGIALDDGRVIGLVGPSGRGKTTASRILATDRGYVTDEALGVLTDLTVVPYPKPLSIVRVGRRKEQLAPSELGLRPASTGDLRLAALVLLDRRDAVAAPWVENVPLIEALAELVEQSSFLVDLPTPLSSLTNIVAAVGGIRRVVYSEAADLSGMIDSILATTVQTHSARTSVAKSSADEDTDTPDTYVRTAYRDAMFLDDDLVILRPGSIVALAGVGPSLWLAASGVTRDELLETLLHQVGSPPDGVDAGEMLDRALDDLLERNVLALT